MIKMNVNCNGFSSLEETSKTPKRSHEVDSQVYGLRFWDEKRVWTTYYKCLSKYNLGVSSKLYKILQTALPSSRDCYLWNSNSSSIGDPQVFCLPKVLASKVVPFAIGFI